MEAAKKKPNDLLRRLRQEQGWSQRKVADLLQDLGGVADAALIGKWERGEHTPSPFYQEKLCNLYGLKASQLGFIVVDQQSAPAANEQESRRLYPLSATSGSNDGMVNKKRREVLQLISVATASLLLPLPDIDWDKFQRVAEVPSQVDEQLLYDFEALNRHEWKIFRAAQNKSAVLEGALGQLKTLMRIIQDSHLTQSYHQRLCGLASDLAQLIGEIFFDSNQYDLAQTCYNFAANSAKEAKHYDLWACALVRHAFLPLFEEDAEDAIPLLQAAQKLAYRGDTMLATRYWIASVSAQAYASMNDLSACQQNLDASEHVLDLSNGTNGGWLRFDPSRLAEERGSCFVKLERPKLAIPALKEALTQLPTTSKSNRRRGLILTDLAFTTLQLKDIEGTCTYASEATKLASGSGVIRKGILKVRNQLEDYKNSFVVREFDKQLAILG